MSQQQNALVSTEHICRCILVLRGEKVILDADLADLYGVETKALVRAMKRNLERFPDDFMFQLSRAEFDFLRCQFGTSSQWGGRRYPPYAFTLRDSAVSPRKARSTQSILVMRRGYPAENRPAPAAFSCPLKTSSLRSRPLKPEFKIDKVAYWGGGLYNRFSATELHRGDSTDQGRRMDIIEYGD